MLRSGKRIKIFNGTQILEFLINWLTLMYDADKSLLPQRLCLIDSSLNQRDLSFLVESLNNHFKFSFFTSSLS